MILLYFSYDKNFKVGLQWAMGFNSLILCNRFQMKNDWPWVCIHFHQLLDDSPLLIIGPGTNLATEDVQIRLHIHYC